MEKIREMKAVGKDYEISFYVDEEDYQKFRLWEYTWYRKVGKNTTYIRTNKKGERGTNILLHRFILGILNFSRKTVVDHIDHNGLNNCRSNIRITNCSGNRRNSRKQSTFKSKPTFSQYKGVTWNWTSNHTNPWIAQITFAGKNKYLGCFRTEIEAARVYNEAVTRLFDFGVLNDLSK